MRYITVKVRIRTPNAGKREQLLAALDAFRRATAWYAREMRWFDTTSRAALHAVYKEAQQEFPELQPATLQLAEARAGQALRSVEAALRKGRAASTPTDVRT